MQVQTFEFIGCSGGVVGEGAAACFVCGEGLRAGGAGRLLESIAEMGGEEGEVPVFRKVSTGAWERGQGDGLRKAPGDGGEGDAAELDDVVGRDEAG